MARLVVVVIAEHLGSCPERGAFPSIETIAVEANAHRASVMRGIESARQLGELEVTRKSRTSVNVYRLPKFEAFCEVAKCDLASCDDNRMQPPKSHPARSRSQDATLTVNNQQRTSSSSGIEQQLIDQALEILAERATAAATNIQTTRARYKHGTKRRLRKDHADKIAELLNGTSHYETAEAVANWLEPEPAPPKPTGPLPFHPMSCECEGQGNDRNCDGQAAA